jgi:hypothetical protein
MLYATQFPKGITDFEKGYRDFIGEFLLLFVFTSGLFRTEKALQHGDMQDAIYLFHRAVSHNPTISQHMKTVLEDMVLGDYIALFGNLW